MRFRRIEIPAYGPFENFSAEFPGRDGDFQLIYGPNEAGKSSLLRAMRALLFGIPGQTTDNFRHDYSKLRILAELEDGQGTATVFQRRKGNKDTLLDADGTAIPENELRALLGIVDEAYFNSLFGLGSEELRHGADDLLRGHGRLGEALFSASLGGTPVDKVIQALEEEAGAIYSGRAKRKIREAAKRFDDHQQKTKAHLIKPDAWEEIERGLGAAEAQLATLSSGMRERSTRKEWLVRCRGALPIVGQLAEHQRQIEALPSLPDLSANFAFEIREARARWRDATTEVEQLVQTRARLESRLASCALHPDVLEVATVIDRLHTDLGTYRDHQRGVAAKQGEATAKAQSVQSMCRDLGITSPLDQLESLRISHLQFNEAEQRARRLTAASQALAEGQGKIQDREGELARLRAEPSRGDAGKLKQLSDLIHRAAAVEDTAKGLRARTAALDALERKLRSLHRNLAGAPAELEATRDLPVPARSRIDQFREQIEENRRDAKTLGEEKRKTEETIRQIEAEIERLARQREVPSLDDLQTSRAFRDHAWTLVLQAWKGSGAEETLLEGKSLEEAYPDTVTKADKIADRLRLEAESVAQLEEQRSRQKQEVAKRDALEVRLSALESAAAELSARWKAAWQDCHLEPFSPKEMIEWRETWQELGRLWDQWANDRSQIAADEKSVSALAVALSEALGSGPGDFTERLAGVRERWEALDSARDEDSARSTRIADLEKERETAEESLPKLQEEERAAKAAWEQCCETLTLSPSATPEAMVEALRQRRTMFGAHDQWQGLLLEIRGLQANATRFENEVRSLGESLRIGGETVELQEAALWSALEGSKKAQTEHDGFQQQIAELDEKLSHARSALERDRNHFEARFRQTGLVDDADLEGWLSQLEALWNHRNKVTELRDNLAGLASGLTVDEFVEKVEGEDLANLETELTTLTAELDQLAGDLEIAQTTKREWERRRSELENAQDTAAQHVQNAAFAASEMEADAERFVRLRVAIALLRSQIDTFRRQNQGPFMAKASEWFAEVTGGAFQGIGPSYRDGDDPVIAGLRVRRDAPAEEVTVSGMSEGTRDQLYLALRLAGLELHLQDHEPMPMILDDLLVHFDDGRASNALKALSRLGRKSQVLLFTHHAHVVELARTALGPDGFHLVEIG